MLNKTFESSYVQELGIYDHCVEVVRLKDDIRTLKAVENYSAAHTMGVHMVKEMMDLCLILNEMFGNEVVSSEYQELYDERKAKFAEKEKSDD